MASEAPLYLGFDLSTQQLKGLAVDSQLKVVQEATFDFDTESAGFDIEKGVITNKEEHEVYAPVAMWLQALDSVLQTLKSSGVDLGRVRGISGAGQQHGSVYWSASADQTLSSLDCTETLQEQMRDAFAHPFSPNWQDASTQPECDRFDKELGSVQALAQATGSKAHHRFTGPQILRFQHKYPQAYTKTSRISLVSSFLASLFLGKIAPFDISDVCGMNLWDIREGGWHEKLLALAAGRYGGADLKSKLGDVSEDGGLHLGKISPYYCKRYGFNQACTIVVATGDNPSTILAVPLRPLDAIVSLGTSTTFLMSTPEYKPDPATHFMNHPTTPGLYMFMLCYKNGGLAREKIRDEINARAGHGVSEGDWEEYKRLLEKVPPLAQRGESAPMKMGLYFPKPEIIPNLPAGEWHFEYNSETGRLRERSNVPEELEDNARMIVESQMLSLRLRSKDLVHSPDQTLPPQPRRVYLVGGGSRNKAIAQVAGQVLGGSEGVFKLDFGANACALGAAYKAVWAMERTERETFEDLIGKRWKEDSFVEKVADGYHRPLFEQYGKALRGFQEMEEVLLKRYQG